MGQKTREAGVTRYHYEHRRGRIIFFGDVAATRKHYHVKVKNTGELIIGGVDVVKMWGATAFTAVLVPTFLTAGGLSCELGGPPGCIAGAMLITTAVPADASSTYFLAKAAGEYTRHYWWEHSLDITP